MNFFYRSLLISFFILGIGATLKAQNADRSLTEQWSASWINVPGTENPYEVEMFRKTINLDAKPAKYIVHVSGDNRYKLYVNGQLASIGPARGDIYYWNYETVDLAPYLTNGKKCNKCCCI